MFKKETVWLSIEDIRRKYFNLIEEKKFNESFIGLLFDADLLRGYYDRKKRQTFILEESWLDLLVHMNYNLFLQMQPVNGEPVKFSIPNYCKNPLKMQYDLEKNWYTPSELLEQFEQLKLEKIFTEGFIGELVRKGILRGRYDFGIKCTYILFPSFIELLWYRNYTLKQNMYYPDET